jgi:uncharacterized protein (TIGR00255 family)
MTGFGRGEATVRGAHVVVELASVNRKHLEVHVPMPPGLMAMENHVIALVQKSISRGHVRGNLRVRVGGASVGRMVSVDVDLGRAYVKKLTAAAERLGLRGDISVRDLLEFPGVVTLDDPSAGSADVSRAVMKAVGRALSVLNRMRRSEGGRLWRDMENRLRRLGRLVSGIRRLVPAMVERQRSVFSVRLKDALRDGGTLPANTIREFVALAEKGDVTEELVRMESHLAHMRGLGGSSEPAGRTMEFLCQELLREINTVGSKASDLSVARLVLDFKRFLETIREQVQNVE